MYLNIQLPQHGEVWEINKRGDEWRCGGCNVEFNLGTHEGGRAKILKTQSWLLLKEAACEECGFKFDVSDDTKFAIVSVNSTLPQAVPLSWLTRKLEDADPMRQM